MTRPLVMTVIEQELHTDAPSRDAKWRVDAQREESKDVAPEIATGASEAASREDWMYGMNRRSIAPRRNGLNVSYDALYRGTGVDERALPNRLRHAMLKETDGIVKKRRKAAKEKSEGFTVPKEFEEAIGLKRRDRRRAE